MIFFMTTLIPSSNISAKLKELQKRLFKKNIIIPAPFPLILCSVSDKNPARPSRSLIADEYPSEINPIDFKTVSGNLVLAFNKSIRGNPDEKLIDGIILGRLNTSNAAESSLTFTENFSFKNFSIAAYEVQSHSMDNFWMNMSWVKLWEVQKKKV